MNFRTIEPLNYVSNIHLVLVSFLSESSRKYLIPRKKPHCYETGR